jgi:hypothetical protein
LKWNLELFYKEKNASISNKMKEQEFLDKRLGIDFRNYFTIEKDMKNICR